MTRIKQGSKVTLQYKLKDDQGKVLDDSKDSGPMIYIQGSEDILQAIEDAVLGLAIKDKVSVLVPPAEAYGEYDAELLSSMPREAFDGIEDLQQGMQVQEETPDGAMLVTIKEVTDEEVLVDANHPLAGQSLHFELEIADIKDAT